MFNWRAIYIASIVARFILATSNSYIHPDEHFQSLQVMTSRLLLYNVPIPWEFTTSPARSLTPLYIIYSPLLWLINYFQWNIPPMTLWYVFRLKLFLINWLITDYVLYRLLPTKPERIKSVFFVSTSYITLVHQSHLFSNSVETPLLLVTLLFINDLRRSLELNTECSYRKLVALSVIIVVALFNRITFAAFIVGPSWFILKYVWKHPGSLFVLLTTSAATAAACITIDTWGFNGDFKQGWVVTPWNNLIYNTSTQNLAHHGLHPFYTHLVVNLPQLLGPGLVLLFGSRFSNKYYRTLPFVSMVSGLLIMSLIPHQELRFLMPIVPLAASCFDLSQFEAKDEANDVAKSREKAQDLSENKATNELKDKPKPVRNSWKASLTINSWLVFNLVMCVLMGIFHQGGVVPALDHIHQQKLEGVQVWWRTYSPPTWMLADVTNSTQFITINDENPSFQLGNKQNTVLDTMGIDTDKLVNVLHILANTNQPVYLITPTASFSMQLNTTDSPQPFEEVWHYTYHLDMDHLDFGNIASLAPGLSIYKLSS